jgi:glucose/arabinose dehydrogenase
MAPTIAPVAWDYYDKDAIPQWKNSLLLATLKNQRVDARYD